MNYLADVGRWFFAIGLAVFGAQYIGYGQYQGGLPPVPPWTPGGAVGAYLVGVVLLAASLGIAINKKGRLASLVIGGLFLFCAIFLHSLHFNAVLHNGNDRTRAFETLALGAAAFVLAATLPAEGARSSRLGDGGRKLLLLGRLLFGISMLVFGAQHFMYAAFIATLVTPWIPGHLFWVYLTGVGMIVAGLAIITGVQARLAGAGLGLMFFLWVVVLHAPRVIAKPHNGDELSSLFVALAFAGGSLIVGEALSRNAQLGQTKAQP